MSAGVRRLCGVGWVLGASVGCAQPTDAERYRRALTTDATFARAWESCGGITAPPDRGDCQAAVTERFDRREAGDCEQIEHAVWKDECRFLLAERLGQAGELDGALAACLSSRFRRHCTWHLIEDAVEATLDHSDAAAEQALEPFFARRAMPDAAFQFWRVRHRLKNAEGVSLSEEDCEGLRFRDDCRRALHLHVQTLLDELARSGADRVCATPAGRRIMLGTEPALRPGPLVEDAEREWVARRCARAAPAPAAAEPAD